jgi:CRISPR-associated protein Csx10
VIIAGERVYTQTALCAGQVFTGTISGNGEYLRQLEPLLAGRMLRIGKSKTAQYAACKIVVGKAAEISLRPPEIIVPGKETAVILLADALLLKNGVYTTDRNALLEAIGLGAEIREEKTSLAYRIIAGYSGVWNLKKPHARAFKAGSVLVYKSIDAAVPKEFSIGERRHEGFGLCKAMALEDMPEVKTAMPDNLPGKKQGRYSSLMQSNEENEKIRAAAIAYTRQNRLDAAVTSSQIGRVLLMLKQSNGDWKNFQARIASIKTIAVKNALQSYLCSEISEDTKYWETVLRWWKYHRKAESAAKGVPAK